LTDLILEWDPVVFDDPPEEILVFRVFVSAIDVTNIHISI